MRPYAELSEDRERPAALGEAPTQLKNSAQWKQMLIAVTYDENGGGWDHVAPPRAISSGPARGFLHSGNRWHRSQVRRSAAGISRQHQSRGAVHARAGRPRLDAADIDDVIAFLKTLTDGYRAHAGSVAAAPRPSDSARSDSRSTAPDVETARAVATGRFVPLTRQ